MASGADRSGLGFDDAVVKQFVFLESFGLFVTRSEPTFVRYESEERFVNVFHGRLSYEIGVEVGRWVDVDGEVVVEQFSLAYLDAIRPGEAGSSVRGLTAVSREQVARFVAQFAVWAEVLLPEALSPSSDRVFAELQTELTRQSALDWQGYRAGVLRELAIAAWQDGDFHSVVLAYKEVVEELPVVSLRPSELKRLRYAERRVGELS